MYRNLFPIALAAVSLVSPAYADITYAEILADPDNPALNQQFARERLATGDAKAALAAVERVLVAEPTNLSARCSEPKYWPLWGPTCRPKASLKPWPLCLCQKISTNAWQVFASGFPNVPKK